MIGHDVLFPTSELAAGHDALPQASRAQTHGATPLTSAPPRATSQPQVEVSVPVQEKRSMQWESLELLRPPDLASDADDSRTRKTYRLTYPEIARHAATLTCGAALLVAVPQLPPVASVVTASRSQLESV